MRDKVAEVIQFFVEIADAIQQTASEKNDDGEPALALMLVMTAIQVTNRAKTIIGDNNDPSKVTQQNGYEMLFRATEQIPFIVEVENSLNNSITNDYGQQPSEVLRELLAF